jgi:guanylate kinase
MARVFVITGPSGVGKGTLIRGLMERLPELRLSVSATTRPPRPGEQDGVDYYFLTPDEFDQRARDGHFVEHARYAGRRYGTLHSELAGETPGGRQEGRTPDDPVVLEIEVQGARRVREAVPDAVQVFIAPPSLEALRERLTARGTDDPQEVERRLLVAGEELAARPEFAHVVVNDSLEDALAELTAIVGGELGAGEDATARPAPSPSSAAPRPSSAATTLKGNRGKAEQP